MTTHCRYIVLVALFCAYGPACSGKGTTIPTVAEPPPDAGSAGGLYKFTQAVEGDVRPQDWAWFVGDQGTQAITPHDVFQITDDAGTAIDVELQCAEAEDELIAISKNVATKKTDDPTPESKYFRLVPLNASFVTMANDYTKLAAKAEGGFLSSKMNLEIKHNKVSIQLLLSRITSYVVATKEFTSCVRNTLKNAGRTGRYKINSKLLVGDGVLLAFDATSTSGELKLETVFDAELQVDLGNAHLTYFQVGRSINLDATEVLAKLRMPNPDPPGAIDIIREKSDGYGYLATQQSVVEVK